MAGSLFLFLAWAGDSSPWLETPAALLFFLLLLRGDRKLWFWSGFFLGVFWFGWIGVSFLHYGHPWAIPLVALLVAFVYALDFWIFALLSETLARRLSRTFSPSHLPIQNTIDHRPSTIDQLLGTPFKALSLLLMSYLHPFGFDWLKPELPLIHTPFGIDKLHFALLLFALCLFLLAAQKIRKKLSFLSILPALTALPPLLLALHPGNVQILHADPSGKIVLAGTHVPVESKWRRKNLRPQIQSVLQKIDRAIAQKARLVLLPESVLPLFLNRDPQLLQALKERSRRIHIVLGSLYTAHGENRNSAYHFYDGRYTVADKVALVPFGEYNPLPSFLSRLVNEIFFDGAPDYRPAKRPTDFLIDGRRYRSAVCYEGTSERLYSPPPRRILLISNDGWFVPSQEFTLQRLLLEYYVRKYGTTIYHSVNMGEPYILKPES